jgi:MFS family permease
MTSALRKPLIAQTLVVLEPMRVPAYRYLLLNNVFHVMGGDARLMAQAWLILALTNSDGWVGTVTGLPALAAAATALLGGVLADRLDRRRLLIAFELVLAAVALLTALMVATDVIRVWHLLTMAFVIALAGTSGATVSQSIVVDVVPREQLFAASVLHSASANLATMVGPALAGILMARLGIEYAFYLSAVFLVGAALTSARLRVARRTQAKPTTTIYQDLQSGLRHVARTPLLQWLLLLGLTAMAVGVWLALLPRFARDVVGVGAEGYGAILSARGLGGLIGMLTLIAVGRVRRLAMVLVACALAFATLAMLFIFSKALTVATVIAFGLGIVFIWWPTNLRTAFQFAATEEMRGRVMSLFSMVAQILTLGWFVGGLLSEMMSPQAAMIIAASVCALVNVLAYLRSPDLRAIGRTDE